MRAEEIHEAAICEIAKLVYRVRTTMIELGIDLYCDLPTFGVVYAAFLPVSFRLRVPLRFHIDNGLTGS